MSIKIKLKRDDSSGTGCKGCAYEHDNRNCPRLPNTEDGWRRNLMCISKGSRTGGNYIWIMTETQ